MKTSISFLLNRELKTLESFDPNQTVLEYLRVTQRRCGTKEGCAEGDCGACTVVVVELEGQGLRYRAVNSCLLFLGNLDGVQLLTVEDLGSPCSKLHPVQSSMVDSHGSQCGFCTPGFIMSLFALYKSESNPSLESLEDSLVGNLCRCTGYRPILEAGKEMIVRRIPDQFSSNESETFNQLRLLNHQESVEIKSPEGSFHRPSTLDDLSSLYSANPNAFLLAGGTDLGLLVTKMRRKLGSVISLAAIKELRTIEEDENYIKIGATVTYTDALPLLKSFFPAFEQIVLRLGSRQIRNLGTIGGNIANASPIGDSPPALLALEAELTLRELQGERQIPLADFFVGYRATALRKGEFIEAIKIPKLKDHEILKIYKISKRFDQDISTLCVAIKVGLEGQKIVSACIAFGGMAAIPARAYEVERNLIGRVFSEETFQSVAKELEADFQPISDFRGSSNYRMIVAKNLMRKFFLEAAGVDFKTGVL